MSEDRNRDDRFGETALSMGLVSRDQLEESRGIQKKMSEMGIREPLSSVMLKRGFIDPSKVTQVLKSMGVAIHSIGGYELLGKLGSGGMGTVYRARQASMDRIVALKVLDSRATKSKGFVERFIREAKAAAKLNHKNIIGAYDVGMAQGMHYFAMEYVQGKTAHEMVKKNGPLTERKALALAAQVADALAYIHEHGLIHRDIKPENLMVDAQGTVKLCDFGLAREAEGLSLTRDGVAFGTPYYMSPEQISGRSLDIRTDLYSLGASLFFLLTGRVVFEGKDLRAVLSAHLTEPAPSPRVYAPSLSESTCAIVAKLLEKDPDRRYARPEQAAQDLRAALSGAELVHAARKKKRFLWILVAAAGALLVAGGIAALSGGDEPPPPPKSPDPSPIVVRPLPPPPQVDEREVRAEGLFHRAEAAFQESRWDEALRSYRELEEEHVSTELFAARKKEIWARRAECERRCGEEEAARRAAQEAQERRVREKFARAQASMTRGEWSAARDEYQKLLAEKLPDDLSEKELRRLAEECDREIRAAAMWAAIEKMDQDMAWDELQRGLRIFEESYRGTRQADDTAFRRAELKVSVAREIQCREAVADLKVKFDAGRWEQVVDGTAALPATFKETRTLERSQATIQELYTRAREKAREPLERKAAQRWTEAQAAMGSRDYAKAETALTELTTEPLAATDKAKELAAPIAEMRAQLAKILKEAREKAAEELFGSVKAHVSKLKWDEAQEELQNFNERYKDTDVARRRGPEIARLGDRIEAELQKFKATMIDDFESGVKGWAPVGDGDKAKAEEAAGHYGDKGARMSFPGPRAKWAFLEKKLPRKPPEDARGLSMWVRAIDRAAKFRIQVRQGEGGEQVVWGAEKVAGTDWMLVKIPLSEMVHVWSPAADKKQPIPKFDLSKVITVEISQGGAKSPAFVLLIDHIKWETRR
jgi:serine/threonine-protein kinase